MGFFTSVTKAVDLDGGNTVTIKRVTYGERQEAASKAVKAGMLDMPRYQLELLCRAVVSWDGPDFEGRPASAENVAELPGYIADKLVSEATALAELTADEGN
jgi:hypothetical protein